MTSLDDAATHWREVAPFLWREMNGRATLGAVVSDNRVVAFMTDDRPPVAVFQRVPRWLNAGRNIPLLLLSLTVIALTAVGWPIAAVFAASARARSHNSAPANALPFRANHRRVRSAVLRRVDDRHCPDHLGRDRDERRARSVDSSGAVHWIGGRGRLARGARQCRRRAPRRGVRSWRKGSEVLIAISCVAIVWFAFLFRLISTRLELLKNREGC